MNKVCIVGGAGFIGSHLTEELLSQGHEVAVYDDFSGGRRENLPEHDQLQILERLDDPFMEGAIVYHLAAAVDISGSYTLPLSYVQREMEITSEVLSWATHHKANRIIYVSSSGVYDKRDKDKHKREIVTNIDPATPYAASKIMGETLVQMAYRIYEIPCISVRPFNVYGPRQRTWGVDKPVIPSFIQALLTDSPLVIQGDGKQKLDFIYVKDVARWLAGLVEVHPDFLVGDAVNLGTGQTVSIHKLAETLMELVGKKVKITYEPSRRWYFKEARAATHFMHLIYPLEYTPLKEGLRETIEYYQERLETYFKKVEGGE